VWDFGSQETSPACLAYRARDEAPPATCPTYRAHRQGHTVTCSCVNSKLVVVSVLDASSVVTTVIISCTRGTYSEICMDKFH
jgi:hypothetical protein